MSKKYKRITLVFLIISVFTGITLWNWGGAKQAIVLKHLMSMDQDNDGALSKQELGALADESFDKFDADNDGKLAGDELKMAVADRLEKNKKANSPLSAQPSPLDREVITKTDISNYVRGTMKMGELSGIAVLAGRGPEQLYYSHYGAIDEHTVIPIASSSKWLTAAVLLSLVDQGVMSLDAPLSDILPYLEKTPNKDITLRQALSHTTGMGWGHLLNQPQQMALQESAHTVASINPNYRAGTGFFYTGNAMQVAAAAAEVATGKPWATLFRDLIGTPLGMTKTVYGHPLRPLTPGGAPNFIVAGGVHSTARDYYNFLEMIAGSGLFKGKRVLSSESVKAMLTNQTLDVNFKDTPVGTSSDWGYGLGVWCEQYSSDGHCIMVNSGGAFGVFPWHDSTTGLFGVIYVKDQMPRLVVRHKLTRRLIDKLFGQDRHRSKD